MSFSETWALVLGSVMQTPPRRRERIDGSGVTSAWPGESTSMADAWALGYGELGVLEGSEVDDDEGIDRGGGTGRPADMGGDGQRGRWRMDRAGERESERQGRRAAGGRRRVGGETDAAAEGMCSGWRERKLPGKQMGFWRWTAVGYQSKMRGAESAMMEEVDGRRVVCTENKHKEQARGQAGISRGARSGADEGQGRGRRRNSAIGMAVVKVDFNDQDGDYNDQDGGF
ncbi:uncharacterized protein BJ171DRAFT_62977 [Polychytrium aggregatum]|uniref:uncharacterized protein n=1 Tax=Polychytrium aggregatum TaxID=110093 RepID=UPI0022FEE1B2|nr:uncharacterized protein BJ171DRAFT_62977 [Polychytrium aggregatum]KAI9205572.1 hypothetical protein BJ171DRAFT_62977 [Polychytrium aggregatum]